MDDARNPAASDLIETSRVRLEGGVTAADAERLALLEELYEELESELERDGEGSSSRF